jgi:hypothetical protein
LKTLLTFAIVLFTNFAFGQKSEDYLISYTDTTSGSELIGFKSENGKIIIKAEFNYAYNDTLYKMAIVLKNGKWVGIDRNGNIVLIPFIYDNGPDYVEEGLFRFVENNKIGFANMSGQKKILPQFDFATPFEGGLSEYTLGGHWEYDKSGEHRHWTGGYENGYLNKFGQRFKKVTVLKNNKRQAWTTNNNHVLLNRNGQIIKTYVEQYH